MVKAGAQLLGIRALMRDMGIGGRIHCKLVDKNLKILTDASAAKGVAQRLGLGQMRHIEVTTLWLQNKVRTGEILIEKVGGKCNLADALTKYPDGEMHRMHMTNSALRVLEGRHELAPAPTEDDMETLS